MTMAATLTEAAYLTYDQASLKWAANTLKAAMTTFNAALSAQLQDAVLKHRRVGNWCVLIAALIAEMPAAGVIDQVQFNRAVEYVYRACFAATSAEVALDITFAQSEAIRTGWNTSFGT